MDRNLRVVTLALVAATFTQLASAQTSPPPTPAEKAEISRLEAILDKEKPQFGDVQLAGPQATLHLGKAFYFLGPEDAKQVLKEWGNPPDAADGVLGIVFPAGKRFVDDTWGAVITYENMGFVVDKDADKTDYAKMARDEQAAEGEENDNRKQKGFQTIHLMGWAQPPSYDKARHTLIWARDLQFGGEKSDSLNYDLRVLGRRGVLSVNLVSKMSELPAVRADAGQLANAITFNAGAGYGDVQPSDKRAELGVAGLVAAGLGVAAAQKFGLLAVILLVAKKGLVFIVAGFAAAAAWFRRRLGIKAKTAAVAPVPTVESGPDAAA